MKQVIIQCSIAQKFKGNGTYNYCINEKQNKNPTKCTNTKKSRMLYDFCRKSSNKADKQMSEAETIIETQF